MAAALSTDSSQMSRVAFAGGYSAGHLIPGIAIAERLQDATSSCEVVFLGSLEGPEEELIRLEGLPFEAMPVISYVNRPLFGKLMAILAVLRQLPSCRRILREANVRALVTLGSYVGVAPSIAARSLGIPIAVLEPNAGFGRANRLCAKVANEVWVSGLWDDASELAHGHQVGVPMRRLLDDEVAGPRCLPEGKRWRVLVLGGSLGHRFLNEQAAGLWAELKSRGMPIEITHICGYEHSVEEVKTSYEKLGLAARVETFLSPLIPAMAEADFILTSAGAVSLHEIASLGIPCLTVPMAVAADGHQFDNAERFQEATSVLTCTEEAWTTEVVADQVYALWRDESRYQEVSKQLLAFNPRESGLAHIQETLYRWLYGH